MSKNLLINMEKTAEFQTAGVAHNDVHVEGAYNSPYWEVTFKVNLISASVTQC